jgi:hypothetical protein
MRQAGGRRRESIEDFPGREDLRAPRMVRGLQLNVNWNFGKPRDEHDRNDLIGAESVGA